MYSWFNNIRLPWLIFTLLVFAALVKLALWQVDRAEQKTKRLAKIAQYSQQQTMPVNQLLKLLVEVKDICELNDINVNALVMFDADHVFLLDNQVEHGQVGYRVLQLATIITSDKLQSSIPNTVVVNLGWIPAPQLRSQLPSFHPVAGQHSIKAHIRVPEQGFILKQQQFQKIQWPLRIEQFDLAMMATLAQQKLLPFALYLDKKEPIGFVKNWQPIVMSPEKHRAYAFQWASLAIAWLILMLWAAHKNNNKAKKHDTTD